MHIGNVKYNPTHLDVNTNQKAIWHDNTINERISKRKIWKFHKRARLLQRIIMYVYTYRDTWTLHYIPIHIFPGVLINILYSWT